MLGRRRLVIAMLVALALESSKPAFADACVHPRLRAKPSLHTSIRRWHGTSVNEGSARSELDRRFEWLAFGSFYRLRASI